MRIHPDELALRISLGEHALAYLTELVHHQPQVWIPDVDQHALLERYGDDALGAAFAIGRAHAQLGVLRAVQHAHARALANQPQQLPSSDHRCGRPVPRGISC